MQWLVLVISFALMALLQRLTRGAPVEARATVALGFLILIAYLAGTLAQRFRISRVVGFLAAGLIASPAWLGFIRGDELAALAPVANGALALIAFAVGSELTLDVLRRERRVVVSRIAGAAIVAPFVVVALVVLTVSPWFPLTAHQPFRDAVVVAISLGALAAVSSPTLTWAVANDLEASGPLTRTTLDVTVLQDLVAIVLLIVTLALALVIASAGAVTPGIATHTLLMLLASLAAGLLVGLGAAEYLRVISGRLTWVFVVLAFVVAQAVRLMGMDAVVCALAAGCTLRNASPVHSERVRTELKRCAIPVYVVFFALAGASLQFGVLADMWPWVLLLVALRITGLRAGLRWAGTNPAVGADWVSYGWLGLLSQGGLAVTLAAVLRRAFPEWNVSLEALLVGMIGVHQLAGPICYQWALRRAGEVTQAREVWVSHERETPRTAEHAGDGTVAVTGSGGSSM